MACQLQRPGQIGLTYETRVQMGVDVGVVVGAADRPGADVVERQLGGRRSPGGQIEPLDQAVIVHDFLLVVGSWALAAGAARAPDRLVSPAEAAG
jgi:hypothetical protein